MVFGRPSKPQANAQPAPPATMSKLEEVTKILTQLRDDLEKKNLLPHLRKSALERLKVLSRDSKDADPLYAKEGLHTLLQHSFDSNSASISKEALRCLANAYLLNPESRGSITEFGYVDKLLERYKNEDNDDEFLLSRILFLTTYNSDLDYAKLVEEKELAETINQHVARHVKPAPGSFSRRKPSDTSSVTDDMALAETAKLLYNISYFFPELHSHFLKSIPPLFKILFAARIESNNPIQAPTSNVINVLQNLDPDPEKRDEPRFSALNARKDLYPKLTNLQAERLSQFLDASISAYSDADLERNVSPLLGLIRRIYDLSSDPVKRHFEFLLLPKDEERNRPIGASDTDSLPARLLRLLQSVTLQNFRAHLNDLFFELSHCDASQLSTNLGFGFASGILMSKGLSIPQSAEEAFSTAGSSIAGEGGSLRGLSVSGQGGGADGMGSVGGGNGGPSEPVNPITGQKLRFEEHADEGSEMTEEEKEREAERLYVLFERLRATGVVDVKNPVHEAMESGRLEELPD